VLSLKCAAEPTIGVPQSRAEISMNRTTLLLLASLSLIAGPLMADAPTDLQIQSDRFDIAETTVPGIANAQSRYIEWLEQQGYPIRSIILHAVSRGMRISDVVYLLTEAKTDRAREVYGDAVELLPELPSWACERQGALTGRYFRHVRVADLGPKPSVRAAADEFFQDGARLSPTPDWRHGESHMKASIDELIGLAGSGSSEGKAPWWYEPGKTTPGKGAPLFVSLYPQNKLIVVDASRNQLEQMKQQGVTEIPVVFLYNGPEYIPLSSVDQAPAKSESPTQPAKSATQPAKSAAKSPDPYVQYGDGKVTATEVIEHYLSTGQKVTPVREWKLNDHHLMVDVAELGKLFNLPRKEDIPPKRLERLTRELQAKGFAEPLKITVSGDSGKKWVDNPEEAAVAASMGIKQAPVIFLMHDLQRWPCGVPAGCQNAICEAVRAGGGGQDACQIKESPPVTAPVAKPPERSGGVASPS
jgi:hypothetical protein